MVLEEATLSRDPNATFSSDAQPASDIDPYAGDRDPTVLPSTPSNYFQVAPGVFINGNALPKPFNFFGSSQLSGPMVRSLQAEAQMISNKTGRSLRQDEADALAFYFAKAIRIGSFGAPAGISAGYLMAYRNMDKMRFPGWTPNPENWKFDKFVGLSGWRAKWMWQVVRFNVYAGLGLLAGQIAFGSYALTTSLAGRMADPRLRGLMEELQRISRKESTTGSLPGNREVDTTPGSREGETQAMARQRARIQEQYRNRQREESRSSVDDTSPTGGSFQEEYWKGDSVGDSGLMNDAQSKEFAGFQDQPKPQTQSSTAASPRTQESAPTTTQSKQSSGGGSAWERLRQQAISGGQNQAPQGGSSAQKGGDSGSDSFAFSRADEDSQLARSEAQRDFDERVERERKGEDFSAKRGGWRS